jgi:transaldolase
MEIYADTAQINEIMSVRDMVTGITTNPTLMRKAGVQNYLEHAETLALTFPDKSLSLEVIADEPDEMIAQGQRLAKIASNVIVKIPIVNSRGESCWRAIQELTIEKIRINVTAVFTNEQFQIARNSLLNKECIISVFAGRIADTGTDPVFLVGRMVRDLRNSDIKLLWASTREILNYEHAEEAMCDIVTMTPDLILKRNKLRGKDLTEFSVETAKMFYEDAKKSGYEI